LIAGRKVDYRKAAVRDSNAWFEVHPLTVRAPVRNGAIHPRKGIAINAAARGQIKYSGNSAHQILNSKTLGWHGKVGSHHVNISIIGMRTKQNYPSFEDNRFFARSEKSRQNQKLSQRQQLSHNWSMSLWNAGKGRRT